MILLYHSSGGFVKYFHKNNGFLSRYFISLKPLLKAFYSPVKELAELLLQ